MMTQKEIFDEMNICKRKISQLQKEVMGESDFSILKPKYEEMTRLAQRIGELDTLHKDLLLTETKNKQKSVLTTLRTKLGLL